MNNLHQISIALQDTDLPIYIAGHITPDDDSIGACLSMAYLLKNLHKEVYILLEDKDKNCLKNHDITANIVSSVEHDKYMFLCLDLNETYRLGNFEDDYLRAEIKINIDHHQGNHTGADFVYSDSNMSSTCEIVYTLIYLLGLELLLKSKTLCKSLYTGILTDTKCFTKRLSNDTLYIAQYLINSGINYEEIVSNTIHHRTMYQFSALSKLINEINYDTENSFHYAVIDKSLPEYKNLTHNDIVKILAEEIRKIEGIDLLIVLIKNEKSITAKVASNITKNAHIIAKHFGGGGHKGEAGFTTNLTQEQILQELKTFLNKKNN